MMYFIIGGDNQEYGPIPADTLVQWIAEGRANRETRARAENETVWRPLGAIPEFAVAFGGAGGGDVAVCAECGKTFPNSDGVRHGNYFVCAACKPVFLQKLAEGAVLRPARTEDRPTIEQVLTRDFQLDIGRCFSSAWKTLSENLWPIVGVTAAVFIPYIIVTQVIQILIRLALMPLIGEPQMQRGGPPDFEFIFRSTGAGYVSGTISGVIGILFLGGLFYYYLKLMRGERATLEDAYCGFTRAPVQLLVAGVLQNILATLGFMLCILPGIYLSVGWIFTSLLILDRGLSPREALRVGLRVVSKHWFLIFALLIVTGIVSGIGVLACCVGVFFTMPLASLALTQAYQDIFGTPPESGQASGSI